MGLQCQERERLPGVVSSTSSKRSAGSGCTTSTSSTHEFGPGFIKICTYFPYPAKVWLNGHEWAKRQAAKAGIGFTELANGFASCADPAALQAICDRFGPGDVQGFFDRWTAVIPMPFTDDDKAAGYFWELSMRQVEVSPHPGLRRPASGQELLRGPRHRQRRHRAPPRGPCRFRADQLVRPTTLPFGTRVFSPGTEVQMDFSFKHSRVKQYLKEGRALRIETVINKPKDIGVLARLSICPSWWSGPAGSTTVCL